MINLLPPKEKEHLLLEKRKKLITILGWLVLIFLIFLILVLFSVKFYILTQSSYQQEALTDLKNKYQTPDFLFFKDVIQKHNLSLKIADTFYKKQAYVSDVLKIISEIDKPAALHLTDITIDHLPAQAGQTQDTKILVTIFGVSDSRDDLIIFKSNVEQHSDIKNVYFPPNNWIKPTSINFYMTFEVDPLKN